MSYTVHYKKPNWLFWRKIKNVHKEGVVFFDWNVRWFGCENNCRYEFPSDLFMFKLSKEHFSIIHKQLEADTGKTIPIIPPGPIYPCVSYRSIFGIWRKIKRVTGDTFFTVGDSKTKKKRACKIRMFELEDRTRYEIPMTTGMKIIRPYGVN